MPNKTIKDLNLIALLKQRDQLLKDDPLLLKIQNEINQDLAKCDSSEERILYLYKRMLQHLNNELIPEILNIVELSEIIDESNCHDQKVQHSSKQI
jgi:hypothetical protein